MNKSPYLLLLLLILFLNCHTTKLPTSISEPIRIAFGSCADQDKPMPLLEVAATLKPDCFLFLGDNIYGDSRIMDTLQAKYDRLAAKSEFQQLKATTKIWSVWDDHDYGENDAGKYYPFKEESKAIFMDFWEVPQDSDRRKHEGIYGVEWLRKGGLNIQVILLDTRTFRSNLLKRKSYDINFKNDYVPNPSPDSTFLGGAQWKWLEKQFSKKADLRIIASSNQFSHSYNGWESWTNVPREQQRMIDLIKKTKANGVVFVSGDVHWGEISKMEVPDSYSIYDVTSSGITKNWPKIESNDNRIGEAVPQNNIGLIEVKNGAKGLVLWMGIYDVTGEVVLESEVELRGLGF